MERVGTLIDKLKKQFDERQNAANLLGTVQLLMAELQQIQSNQSTAKVSVVMPSVLLPKEETVQVQENVELNPTEQEIVQSPIVEEVNPPVKNPIKKEEQLGWLFEPMDTIPTLAHQEDNINKEFFDLNEKLTVSENNLNDSHKENKTEVASLLQSTPVKDLKKAIGINDRYLFINELFRGDEDMYERSIKTINSFNIYAEAEYWIQRELIVKIGWNEDAENVQAFIQLVKRRFS
jgi:hypothetical protein